VWGQARSDSRTDPSLDESETSISAGRALVHLQPGAVRGQCCAMGAAGRTARRSSRRPRPRQSSGRRGWTTCRFSRRFRLTHLDPFSRRQSSSSNSFLMILEMCSRSRAALPSVHLRPAPGLAAVGCSYRGSTHERRRAYAEKEWAVARGFSLTAAIRCCCQKLAISSRGDMAESARFCGSEPIQVAHG
jgi:hypothetical protein